MINKTQGISNVVILNLESNTIHDLDLQIDSIIHINDIGIINLQLNSNKTILAKIIIENPNGQYPNAEYGVQSINNGNTYDEAVKNACINVPNSSNYFFTILETLYSPINDKWSAKVLGLIA